jgi:hypothetical protein
VEKLVESRMVKITTGVISAAYTVCNYPAADLTPMQSVAIRGRKKIIEFVQPQLIC